LLAAVLSPLLAQLGHAAMSDLSPLCASKRKLNVTTIWLALALLCLALIGAAALTPKNKRVSKADITR
jgi:hypothetical protein